MNDKLNLGIEGNINIGHVVNVHFVRSPSIFNAQVLYIPQGPGDSWHLKTKDGTVYVQMFERMELIG